VTKPASAPLSEEELDVVTASLSELARVPPCS
jgi:hypothetical protein